MRESPRRAFFVGCSPLQLPYLEAARHLGFEIVATDRDPDAPGLQRADRAYFVGYDDREGMSRVAREEGRRPGDRIFTAASHLAYEGAAHLAAELGVDFPRFDQVECCLDKTRFYAFLEERCIPVPPTRVLEPGDEPRIEAGQIYFLKSDYGKSPRYCYRIEDGRMPDLPLRHDAFYRRAFLLQDGVAGTHYRVNLYADQAAVFLKFSDCVSVPLPDLGSTHQSIVERLREIAEDLGCASRVTKFDLIINREGWFVIDIGLDPPLRLRLLCEHLGIDWYDAYTRHYLLEDPTAIPRWDSIQRPVLIRRDGAGEVTFAHLDGAA